MLAWSAVYFGGILLIGLTMMALLGPQFIGLAQKGQLLNGDPAALGDMLAQSWPAFILVLGMTALLMSLIAAGVMRLVLRPAEPGFAHLHLSHDELRLTLANLACVGIYAVSGIVGVVFSTGAAQSGTVGVFITAAITLGFAVWIGVRLCLLLPMVFVDGRIAFRKAWTETKGRFWPLLGMISLAVVFYVALYVGFSLISVLVVKLSGGQAAIQDISRLTPVSAIAAVITLIMQFLLQVLQIVMIYAPFAVAQREVDRLDADPAYAAPDLRPAEYGIHPFFATYDEAFSSWSGAISASYHWSALGYWFLSFMVLVVFGAGLVIAVSLFGDPSAAAGAEVLGLFALTIPLNLMLLLSTAKRGRSAGIPGWLTAVLLPFLPLVALIYAFLPVRAAAQA
jgi:hypothetical protein